MLFKKTDTHIQRKYIISSSFLMAIVFTLLLCTSILSLIYMVYITKSDTPNIHIIPLSISICCILMVIIISYVISIFVVKKINSISSTAISIINTQDLSRRIDVDTKWDDLSNLGYVLNILLTNIEDLLDDIKNVSDNIAHDLRTPLTRLRNNLDSLDKKYQNDDTAKALKDCDLLLSIFSSLLQINRLEHGKQRLNKNKQNIKNVINDAIELYEPIADEKNIKFYIDIESRNLYIDKNLIFQSIINVLDNAIKFSSKDSFISIKAYLFASNYRIEITDNGVGIQEENSKNIFDKFFIENNSRSQKGNGLGLVLVKKTIELHNGNVYAKPNEPDGLQIILEIPIH